MACTVFYSWQSDLPNAANRGFIEKALENTVKVLRSDDSITVDPVVDRDTAGIPGSPDIGAAIFAKIDKAAVFVCDISIVTTSSMGRPSPNPNVLIELGYALKSLGPERVLMVMNTAFGGPELLPFDLRMKRVLTYKMEESAEERSAERRKLEGRLDEALRIILAGANSDIPGEIIEPKPVADQLLESIDLRRPDQVALARRFMQWLVQELLKLAPDRSGSNFTEELLTAIDKSLPLVATFGRVAESIAAMAATDAGIALFKNFDGILAHYQLPRGVSGSYRTSDFDFFKFLGHELLVTLIAHCLMDSRWELISEILAEEIYFDNPYEGRPGVVSFERISEHLDSLIRLSAQKGRTSVHADVLNERHTTGGLGRATPMDSFMEADFLLYLRAELSPNTPPRVAWRPWSSLYLTHTPRFIAEATRRKHAERLLKAVDLGDMTTFKERLLERSPLLNQLWSRAGIWYHPLSGFKVDTIATRP